MPIFTQIEFDNPINTSLQVGDWAYVSDILAGGVIGTPQFTDAKILKIEPGLIWIDKDPAVAPIITSGQYILFAKNINVNESSLKGYYADVTFENSSNKKTELFAISSEVALSSK